MEFTLSSTMRYGRGYVYSIQYHIVWCTKYRKPVLVGAVEEAVKTSLMGTMESLPGQIVEMEVMPDHIHLLLDCSPQFFIPDAIKQLKGNAARRLFIDFPSLKGQLWGGHLWNPSYCALSVSDRSREQIIQYIRSQKEE